MSYCPLKTYLVPYLHNPLSLSWGNPSPKPPGADGKRNNHTESVIYHLLFVLLVNNVHLKMPLSLILGFYPYREYEF